MKIENKYFKISIISATICGLGVVYFLVDARYSVFYPKCPFFSFTGWYCPGCGSQRAVSAFVHGDIAKAAGYNILFATSLPVVIYSASAIILNLYKTSAITQRLLYSRVFLKMLFIFIY